MTFHNGFTTDRARRQSVRILASLALVAVAGTAPGFGQHETLNTSPVAPRVVTEPVRHDSDDPAIWYNREDPAATLVLGTDKDRDGALYVFDLHGRIVPEKVVRGLARPNNVDIVHGLVVDGRRVDVAVVTERYAHRLRVFRLPDMAPLDGGGIPVFEGERARDCMGIALYRRANDGAVFAIVSRSEFMAPREGYLAQYRLVDDGTGTVRGVPTRRFGWWSGRGEIEALAVDPDTALLYASDEDFGVRIYRADPAAEDAEDEVGVFGEAGFEADREGISIYRLDETRGYILVSNQGADRFEVFERSPDAARSGKPRYLGGVRLSTRASDGSEVVAANDIPGFPGGLFVAMSTDRTFQFYAWADIAEAAGLEAIR